MSEQSIGATRLRRDQTMDVAERLRGRFQLVGSTGSGYTRITAAHTDRVLLGDRPLHEWDAPALLVMRQLLSAVDAATMRRWGVESAFDTVRQLATGEAILLER